MLGTAGAGNLIRVLSSAILTRLLSSDAFGVVGFITSVSFILTMLSDVGIMPFVVRHQAGATAEFLNDIWTLRLIRSLVLAAVNALLSWPLAAYAGKPELQPVLFLWSLSFVLDGVSSMSFAVAIRERMIKRLALFDLSAAIIQVFVSVTLVLYIKNYWAIVYAILLGSLIKSFMSYIIFPGSARKFSFNKETTIELWRFSRFIGMSSILTIAISQSDKLYFGRVLPLAALGLYALASTLANAPLAAAMPYADRILYPSYAAAVRDNADVRATYYQGKRRFTLLYMLAVGILIGAGPLIVKILYDPRYAAVGPMLQILAFGPLLFLNNLAADRVLIATGRPWNTMAVGLMRVIWLVFAAIAITVTGNPWLLIFFIGFIEIPATLFHWFLLKLFDLFDLKEELVPLGVAAGGILTGTALTFILSPFFR